MDPESVREGPPIAKKQLAMLLSRLPKHPAPDPSLEQVHTPGDVAAMLLIEGWYCGDIADRFVVDLGCGTGVLSLGAAALGAEFVTGYDVDAASLDLGMSAIRDLVATPPISFHAADVRALSPDGVVADLRGDYAAYLAANDVPVPEEDLPRHVDTVVMNPPFGADLVSRERGGDRVFLERAFGSADVVLSIHPQVSERFLKAFSRDHGFAAARMARVKWALPAVHAHHQKRVHSIDVGLYRFERQEAVVDPRPARDPA